MDELGHPDSAMIYYKTAEANAAPDDYSNLGFINLRIANLYQNIYGDFYKLPVCLFFCWLYFAAFRQLSP